MRSVDVEALIEEGVAAHAITTESVYLAVDLEGRPTVDPWALHPRGLAWRIVWHLILEEDDRPAVAVPLHLVLLVVLDEQPVRGHVVTVDDDSRVSGVGGPADAVSVIGPPRPDVVEDHVVGVDHQAGRGLAGDPRRRCGRTHPSGPTGRRPCCRSGRRRFQSAEARGSSAGRRRTTGPRAARHARLQPSWRHARAAGSTWQCPGQAPRCRLL